MYRFSFVEHVAGPAQEVDRQLFHQIITREKIKETCQQIAAQVTLLDQAASEGERSKVQNAIGKLKRSLPAFCWHAWFQEGKRKNYAAQPSGLIMIDVDHLENPQALWKKNREKCLQLHVLAVHVTPSTRGLRLVFPIPEGMDIIQAQTYYARALELEVDACTKDLARLSFCVPQSYWLYVDEDALFDGEEAQVGMVVPESNPPVPGIQMENTPVNPKGKPGVVPGPTGSPISTPPQYPLVQSPEVKSYPTDYDSIPYPLLVESLQELLGGIPAHGSRNNFIFSMAAYLRYVCDDDARWIAQLLPTYGESSEKWRRTIDSACQRAQYKAMPSLVKRAIENARHKLAVQEESEDQEGNNLPPEMPKKLPKLIAHLVKNVPEVCKPAVANAVFPALAAHLHNVKFMLIDGTEKEATFMCVTIARQSSGKSAVNKPIEYIVADIVERDELNRKREQEWKEATSSKGANKEKPKRPDDLCVQVLVSDMTNAAFVQRMKDAGGKYLYTNLEELDLLKQLQTNGTKDVGKIICLCFDNGKYGQERVGTQSVTARVDLRWNWNASTTIQKGLQFFQGRLVDGTLSRVNFCTIVQDKSKPFIYGQYDEKYAETLKPYIANLNLATGTIVCKQALDLARRMSETCIEEGVLTDDDVYQDLSYRAVTIAYLKAMVLYIANDMTWSKEISEFAEWSLRYDLWCKCHFFGQQVSEEKAKEKVKSRRGRRNLLDMLPESFTLQEAMQLRKEQGMIDSGCSQMISSWAFRGFVEKDQSQDRYVKTVAYLERKRRAA